jgi:hypothetical protein
MQIDFSKITYDGKWYNAETGEEQEPTEEGQFLKVRQRPNSMSNVYMKDGAMVLKGDEVCENFVYCLMDCRGYTDGAGKNLKLTDEMKRKIFDFEDRLQTGMVAAVNDITGMFRRRKAEEEKN